MNSALSSNPALELLEESRCPQCHRPLPHSGPCPNCSAPKNHNGEDPIVFVSPRGDFFRPKRDYANDETPSEEWTAAVEDLPTFVMRQIAPELQPEDRVLAAHILTSLDDDGLLTIPLLEIARYHHVPMEQVIAVQEVIQRSEPLGVGSSSPLDALKIQLKVLAETHPVPTLAEKAVEEGIDLLSRRSYTELSRRLHISINQAMKLVAYISDNLNPFPARAHWGEFQQSSERIPTYGEPDIIITLLEDDPQSPFVVEVVSPYAGSLRVNPLFRQALDQAPEEKAAEWQGELEEAVLLVKCLQQRNNTLVRLLRKLVCIQREFIIHGDAHLKPITRAQLANELEVHELTISRAVSGKAIQLPSRKIIPLSKWFDRSLNVRTALIEIIENENQPLSDTQIASMLEDKGFCVARRTVAKYRSIEGILPARLRQSPMTVLME